MKKEFLKKLAELGTKKAAAQAVGLTLPQILAEEIRSSIFKKRVAETKMDAVRYLAETALDNIRAVAFGESKGDKTTLLANVTLANAFEPGFKTQRIEGKILHAIEVRSAVPRPLYKALPAPKTKKLIIRDKQGNYIGTKIEKPPKPT